MSPEQAHLRLLEFTLAVRRGETPSRELLEDVAAIIEPAAELPLATHPELRKGDVAKAMGLSSGWQPVPDGNTMRAEHALLELVLRGVNAGHSTYRIAQAVSDRFDMAFDSARKVVRRMRPEAEAIIASLG